MSTIPKAQAVMFPSTPEGKVALEHFKATGELLSVEEARVRAAPGEAVLVDSPKPAVLPGLPGGPPLLPSDRMVDTEGDLKLFDGDDVVQALRQLVTVAGGSVIVSIDERGAFDPKAVEATRLVMMFALSIAAVNIGVPMPGTAGQAVGRRLFPGA